ncbi:hypothetical protein BKI52_03310 [marine bacterium AO1-C]|nr:hypothetical protein BKI52_03310 [marine bacterium AO1-C]
MRNLFLTKCWRSTQIVLFFICCAFTLQAQNTYHWTGNGGNNHWTTLQNWRVGSGTPTTIPSIDDQVVFDSDDFAGNQIVVFTGGATCASLDMTAVTTSENVTLQMGGNTLSVAGDFELSSHVEVTMVNVMTHMPFSLIGSDDTKTYRLSLDGKDHPQVTFQINTDGTYQINEDTQLGRLILTRGGLEITTGNTLSIHSFLDPETASKKLSMAGATIAVLGGANRPSSWKVGDATSFTLIDDPNSHILFSGTGIEMDGGEGIVYNQVTFGDATNTTRVVLRDKFTVSNATLNGQAAFVNNDIIFNDLTINSLALSVSGQIDIRQSLTAQGTCNNPLLWTTHTETNVVSSINFTGNTTNFSVAHVMVDRVANSSGSTIDLDESYNLGSSTNNLDWNFTSTAIMGRDLYWVGGTTGAANNNWSNPDNWRVGSVNGSLTTCVPGPTDNVFFTDASFAGGDQTVNVDVRSIYCRDMTWNTGTSVIPTFKNAEDYSEPNKKNRLFISGSLTWAEDMNQNFIGDIHFLGEGSIESNNQTLKARVYFNATGTYTLTDALSISNGGNYYTCHFGSGTLDFNNQNFTCGTFRSYQEDIQDNRTLYLRNSTVNIYNNWRVDGRPLLPDLTIHKGLSTIVMHGNNINSAVGFEGGQQDYHHLEFLRGTGTAAVFSQTGNVEKITVIGKNISLNRTSTSKVQQLIFMTDVVSMSGASGTFVGNGVYGQVTLDPGQTYRFQQNRTQTIDVLIAPGSCSSPISLQTSVIGNSAIVKLGTLSATSDFLYITQVNVENTTTPGVKFIVGNGLDLGANPSTGWDFNSSSSSSRTLYWVGGTITGGSGNWGDQANWSLTSGGTGGECIPTPNDDVIFDVQSFDGNGPTTVQMNLSLQTVRNITWENTVTNNPTWQGTNPLKVYGSFDLAKAVNNQYEGHITFTSNSSSGNYTITVEDGQVLHDNVTIDGQGTWNLGNKLTILPSANPNSYLYFKQGSLNLQGNTLKVHVFRSDYATNRTLNMANATAIVRAWNINSANFTLDATGSEIEFDSNVYARFIGGDGLVYHNIHFKRAQRAFMRNSDSLRVDSVIFNATIENNIEGSGHTIGTVTFHKNGIVKGSHTFGDMVLDPEPNVKLEVQLESDQTQTILNNITAVGGSCVEIFLVATIVNEQAFITKSSDKVEIAYVSLRDINAQGGATFEAHYSIDIQNNSGWDFPNPNTATFSGLGPDFQLTSGATHTFDVEIPSATKYQWYKNGVLITTATDGTHEITEAGTYKVVICFDNTGTCVVEDEVIVTNPACNYALGEATATCGGEEFCVWLEAQNNVPGGMIGMDYCLSYDPTIMEPTGNAELGAVVQGSGNHGEYYLNHQGNAGQVYASIYYNGAAPAGTYFTGKGQIICIRFRLKPGVLPQDVTLNVCQVRETYALSEVEACADAGKLSIVDGAGLTKAQVIYWNQSNGVQPLAFDANNPSSHLTTQIQGVDDNCANPASQIVHPDAQGYFLHKNTNGTKLSITRDISGDYHNPATGVNSSDMMAVINGMDCYYASLITTFSTQDLNGPWSPNAYQMLAADVNMNDVVAASDITLIQKRTVMQIQEYPQVWNYDYSANLTNPVPMASANISYDWRFVNQATLANPDFQIATNYPVYVGGNNNGGFWRDDVPNLSTCQPIQVGSACEVLPENVYYGVMLGDVDGSWTTGVNAHLRITANGELSIDLRNAIQVDANTYKIPVGYSATQTIQAIDFSFEYDASQITIQQAEKTLDGQEAELNMVWNTHQSQKFLLTSYTMKGVNNNNALYYIEVTSNDLQAVDFTNVKAYLNGKPSQVKVVTAKNNLAFDAANVQVNTYPNPASKVLRVTHNLNKQQVLSTSLITLQGNKANALAKKGENGEIIFDVSQLASGVYILQMKSENGALISSKKVFIAR